jgi:hypothetical protein
MAAVRLLSFPVHQQFRCTSSTVKPPFSTHVQPVVFKSILRVPNRRSSPLFFENKEHNGIETGRNRSAFRHTTDAVAHAESPGTPLGTGKPQKRQSGSIAPQPSEFKANCSRLVFSFLDFPHATRGSGRFCVCHGRPWCAGNLAVSTALRFRSVLCSLFSVLCSLFSVLCSLFSVLCSLFSNNSGEPCRFGTRRTRLKTTGYTCVENGGLTGGPVQESGGERVAGRLHMTALCDTWPSTTSGPIPQGLLPKMTSER